METISDLDLEYATRARELIDPSKVDECLRDLASFDGTLKQLMLSRGYLSTAQATELDMRALKRLPEEQQLLGRTLDSLVGESISGIRLRRVTGHTSTGMVFAAVDVTATPVAVKILSPTLANDEQTCRRFCREANILADLRHDNIVRVFETGVDKGLHYTVLEYVAAKSLRDVLNQQGKLALGEVLKLGREVARGLEAAHEHGIFHRDLKPSNLLIAREGRLKIADFALAHVRGTTDLFVRGVPIGSVHTMAPEQCRGEVVDGRCDLYALGCVMFRALTGTWPLNAETTEGIVQAHLTTAPTPLRSLLPDAPESVERLLARCLAKDRDQRFPDARSLAAELEELMGENVLRELGIDPLKADADPEVAELSDQNTSFAEEPEPVVALRAAARRGRGLRFVLALLVLGGTAAGVWWQWGPQLKTMWAGWGW